MIALDHAVSAISSPRAHSTYLPRYLYAVSAKGALKNLQNRIAPLPQRPRERDLYQSYRIEMAVLWPPEHAPNGPL